MVFTRYESAKEFAADTLELLKKYEIQNNLLLKNIGDGPGKTMLTVKSDEGVVLFTAIRTDPFPMVMFETDNIRNDKVVEFFAESVVANHIEAGFIMTESKLAQNFTHCYGVLTDSKFENNENLTLYIIEKVNELPVIEGEFRCAADKDMHYLPYWYADFQPACNIGEYNLNSGIESARWSIEQKYAYVWYVDGCPVSTASSVREVTDCRIIGHVYTPPHFRGKGYSTACVSALTRLILQRYKYCALYADCANPCSNAVYQKIGYKDSFTYSQYKLVER